ncbi:hypothetical protein KKH36_01230 [Patescibacteria group bacterium]|nr:hypothetical protein [Patescibacteria group bacterium]
MKTKGIIAGVIVGLVVITTAVVVDQGFEVGGMEELVERAGEGVDVAVLPPHEFTTDGCSLFPNSFLGVDITDICINHDMQYWAGGSSEARKLSDLELKKEVNELLFPLGSFMYLGIRVFGHPLIPAPWRWGYGFDYKVFERNY